MRRSSIILAYLLAIFCSLTLQAQEEEKQQKVELKGYLKELSTFTIVGGDEGVITDNLLHNRLNFKWYATPSLNFYLEARNRAFFGETVKSNPYYSTFIDQNDDNFDLSVVAVDVPAVVVHSMIDRAYVEFIKNKWEIRAGRQRINWGINVAWNPNDIFNAYSFFDFDYEERPGSDAIRVRYFRNFASSIEVAANVADNLDEWTSALLYKFNQSRYDFQLLGGVSQGDAVIGGGWAGNLGNAGFKGEGTYFHPYENLPDTNGIFVMSVAVDYSFANSIYLNGSVLYNSSGSFDPPINSLFNYTSGRLTAKNLIPYTLSTFVQVSYPFSPLVNGGLAIMYFPGANASFVNPTISYSLATNWDLDLIGQVFFAEDTNGQYGPAAGIAYTRLKWSF